jgi:hypothetical protein
MVLRGALLLRGPNLESVSFNRKPQGHHLTCQARQRSKRAINRLGIPWSAAQTYPDPRYPAKAKRVLQVDKDGLRGVEPA